MSWACVEGDVADEHANEDSPSWEEVPRAKSAPFIHRFRTARERYVYDVNTSRIVRVSPVIWDIIEDHGRLSREHILAKHARSHEASEIRLASEAIAVAQRRDGLFLATRPKQVRALHSKAEIRRILATRRMQLILNVTEACNFRCSYCVYGGGYSHQRAHSARRMKWDIAKAAIDDFLSHSRSTRRPVISFYGGEPLVRPPFIQRCVTYARQYARSEPCFALTTNGSLLAGPTADFLASEHFSILVSLDGPPHVHDRHRRQKDGSPTWAKVFSNVRSFLERRPEYRTNGRMRFNAVVASGSNVRDLEQFFGFCDLFTEQMNLNIALPRPRDTPCRESLRPVDRTLPGALALYATFIRNLKKGVFNEDCRSPANWVQLGLLSSPFVRFHKRSYITPRLPDAYRAQSTCVPGERRLFVSVDGSYFPCERVPQVNLMKIGDVRQGVDICSVHRMLEGWLCASGRECRFCWCLPTCAVGCFGSVSEDGAISQAAKRRACAKHRRNTHRLMVDYCGVLESNPEAFEFTEHVALA